MVCTRFKIVTELSHYVKMVVEVPSDFKKLAKVTVTFVTKSQTLCTKSWNFNIKHWTFNVKSWTLHQKSVT